MSHIVLPITFQPIYQSRVWGGRMLETVYGRVLPSSSIPYGESWEITDRENEQSVVNSGEYSGRTLHELWTYHRESIFGEGLKGERFPLLFKILDARTDLSIQVHPPANIAEQLGGEPKTEMWYIADAVPGSKLYIGLKDGVTQSLVEQSLEDGNVEQYVHEITPDVGDSILLASGRLHAIGGGFLIYEIQQNSDTTYRVFDWNRVGLNGKPRDLHIAESMQCIDFHDFEPTMDQPTGTEGTCISDCDFFYIDKLKLKHGASIENPQPDRFSIVVIVSGEITDSNGTSYKTGDFLVLPKGSSALTASRATTLLQTTIPN